MWWLFTIRCNKCGRKETIRRKDKSEADKLIRDGRCPRCGADHTSLQIISSEADDGNIG